MLKKQIKYFVGIDMASASFAASIFRTPDQPAITKDGFSNDANGFFEFEEWLKGNLVSNSNSLLCLESCGVYNEAFTHYFYASHFKICVEHALKVKKAFKVSEHKTDAIDSKQIAEYSFRFIDTLSIWQPKSEIIEKIQHLITAREQFVKQSTALQNELIAYKRHNIQVKLIVTTHQKHIKELKKSIKSLEKELAKIIDHNDDIRNKTLILKSAPGFGTTLSAIMVMHMSSNNDLISHKKISAYLGLCPFKHESGTSIKKRSKSRGYGPSISRKFLRLAAQSVVTHNSEYKKYYHRKLAEGKEKSLVLNNVANKLIKVACAMIKNNKPYINNYISINPNHLKVA